MGELSAEEAERIIDTAAFMYGLKFDAVERQRLIDSFASTHFNSASFVDFVDGWMYAQWLMSQPAGKELADDE